MGNIKNKILVVCFTIALGISSCKTVDSERESNSSKARIKITLGSEEYNDLGEKATKSSIAQHSGSDYNIRTINVPDKDFNIVAQLIPFDSAPQSTIKSSNYLKAVVTQSKIKRNLAFKLVVYNEDGSYNQEKLYDITETGGSWTAKPTSDGELLLDGGSKYTFVAYSTGQTTVPQNFDNTTLVVPAPAGLSNSIGKSNMDIANLENYDVMYWKSPLITVQANQVNNLDVVLKHMFTAIWPIVRATGFSNTAAGERYLQGIGTDHYISSSGKDFNLNLTNGEMASSTYSPRFFEFPLGASINPDGMHQTQVNGPGYILINNSKGTDVDNSITINNLRINNKTKTVTINNLTFGPSMKYLLVLNFSRD